MLQMFVKMDRARDPDQKLTRFLTRRRFVSITVPTVPLEKIMKMNVFNARIYHKEHKLVKKTVTCSKCLEKDHHASECPNDIVCKACKLSGHKRGDPECDIFVADRRRREEEGVFGTREEGESGERESSRKSEREKESEGDGVVSESVDGKKMDSESENVDGKKMESESVDGKKMDSESVVERKVREKEKKLEREKRQHKAKQRTCALQREGPTIGAAAQLLSEPIGDAKTPPLR
eukprot:TRINITY_DN8081_c0_g1_i4.p1 TRINITY_DN8081_c0_g1~~TRINITY_DN8081_c0_g1_i4.p1  ORF type:complete len:235 (+),score=50.02 TRINITY_DN8081_c0_g1_i4:882-1586(+)